MNFKVFFILLLFPFRAFGDDWTKTDTGLQAVYTITHLMDWSQTLRISEHATKHQRCGTLDYWDANREDCKRYEANLDEMNPFIGSRSSRGKINRYFAGTLVGHYLVARALPKPWRNIWQSFWIGTEYSVATHNKRNGFKYSFSF